MKKLITILLIISVSIFIGVSGVKAETLGYYVNSPGGGDVLVTAGSPVTPFWIGIAGGSFSFDVSALQAALSNATIKTDGTIEFDEAQLSQLKTVIEGLKVNWPEEFKV